MTKQYLVLPEWLQPGVAYWICEHSNGPKPNRCPHCDFTDADRGRALEVQLALEPKAPLVEGYCCCPKSGTPHERTPQCDI